MKTCLICGRLLRETGKDICQMCEEKRITDIYNYIADREEVELIQKLIKVEDLLS